jgi:hypothetical protein
VGCDRLDLDHSAIARDHRIDENWRAGCEFTPAAAREPLVHRAPAAPGKHIGERIVTGS